MRKIAAEWIYPVSSPPIKEGVVVVEDTGEILHIGYQADYDIDELEFFKGTLIPGFINAHCHLELSHLKGKVETGTGLLPFLQIVVRFRDVPAEEIQQAILDADEEMYHNGIVAVGDISNKVDSFKCKQNSAIHYHTFIEMFDFLQDDLAQSFFDQYKAIYDVAPEPRTAVPHSPYTVSPELYSLINSINQPGEVVSIHNQETQHEEDLFKSKTGGFIEFFESFNFSLNGFKPTGKKSIHQVLQYMKPDLNVLLVHNTLSSVDDILAAHSWNENTFWVTCPNANLYIENSLPRYDSFIKTAAKVAIGTDSLSSNWQLSILDEMKTISRYQSKVPFETLLRWATLNGAQALNIDDQFGSIEKSKSPGLNILTFNPESELLTDEDVRVIKLV